MTQKKRIVILLHPADLSRADWTSVSEHQQISHTVLNGALSELTQLAQDQEIIVVIPTGDVLLTQVTLPKLSRQKLLQALPYALEDQLIDDIGNLHFATGEHQPDSTLPVAIVTKTKIQQWIHALKEAQLEPIAIIPAALTLPWDENTTYLYSYDNIHIIRTGPYSGLSTNSTSLKETLKENSTAKTEHHSLTLTKKSFLEKIALEIQQQPYINLLQKPYLSRKKIGHTKNVWRWVAYVVALWVLLLFISNWISFFILHHQANQTNKKIDAIYYHHFPDAKTLTALRERLEKKLKTIKNLSQKNNFLLLLADFGATLSKNKGLRLRNLDYRDGQLTLEVSAPAFDVIDNLIHELNVKGYATKQQNSATAGNQVNSTLIIKAGTT